MKLGKTILAVLAGSAALAAVPAFADNGWHHGWRHHRHFVPAPRVVYVPAPSVYYAPPPAVYAPAPRVVYPAPVYSAPAPVYVQPGVSIRFNLPL